MAKINELIELIDNADLRKRFQEAVNEMNKQKKFGLVFEEHQPECTPLYDIPVRTGSTVALRSGKLSETYVVIKMNADKAICLYKDGGDAVEFPVSDLLCVAKLEEAIYPCLKSIDAVCNAPESDLWHTLIEADNYHALQLLEYLYAGKVSCIYIDPPYNTGAKDWKYNNDYVDSNDTYRHSKWLSMMQKRLRIAKKLLNPIDSVMIITIDEKEYLHLGCLLEEMFPEANIQMISSVINPAGVSRGGGFSRTDEYIYFVMVGCSSPAPCKLSVDWRGQIKGGYKDKLRWNGLQRSGTSVLRTDRPNMFYPIYLNSEGTKIMSVGDPIGISVDRKTVKPPDDVVTVWPIFPDGREGRWRLGKDSLVELINNHYVKTGSFRGEHTS